MQLRILRPNIEKAFPGLNVYLGSRPDFRRFIGEDRTLSVEDLRSQRDEFGYIFNLEADMVTHPVYSFLMSSGVPLRVEVEPRQPTIKCVIVPRGNHPTRDMNEQQIQSVVRLAKTKGFELEVSDDINGSGWVVGVESAPLFEAAAKGIKTSLVETGFGKYLYNGMFRNGEVLKL